MGFSKIISGVLVLVLSGLVGVGSVLADGGDTIRGECTANELAVFSGSMDNSAFGGSVAIDGNVAVVGALWEDASIGAAYVFCFNGSSWEAKTTLWASDWAVNDYFGCSVAISGDTIAVGAYASGSGTTGAAYVFVEPEGGWPVGILYETAKLTHSGQTNIYFGKSVSISGNHVVIGAAYANNGEGRAYVYKKPTGGWTNTTSATKTLSAGSDAHVGDHFGSSVGISDDTIVVGARYDDNDGPTDCKYGSAYVFQGSGSSWSLEAKLVAESPVTEDHFGYSSAISGDTIVVGMYGEYTHSDTKYGAAYVFKKPGSGWSSMTETAKLTASDKELCDGFGKSVSISGDVVVAGAWGDDDPIYNAGSAYVFMKPTGGWGDMTETAKLLSSDGEYGGRFGYSIGISDSTAIVGAHKAGEDDEGKAYTFHGLDDCQTNGTLDICEIDMEDCQPNGIPDECEPDRDGDDVIDGCDNCPEISNPAQEDFDDDDVGDICDNCLEVSNSDQANNDEDIFGDACDNCPTVTNPDQVNSDDDEHGDACDNCPTITNSDQANSDADDYGDACDNCPTVTNPDQTNSDEDEHGDACDNCLEVDNSDQADGDEDSVGDACDNCPEHSNPDQADCDEDDIGDVCALAEGISEDCQANNSPDNCELEDNDCNSNGVPDECDLTGGHNCCEWEHGTQCSNPAIRDCVCAIDSYCCNEEWDRYCVMLVTAEGCGNCEIGSDCNSNGMPDECDISAGTSQDVNPADGVPDECQGEAGLTASAPGHEETLWRTANNFVRLTFNADITEPAGGELLIDVMEDGGLFGTSYTIATDTSADFQVKVVNDVNDDPRVLEIRENGSVLTHTNWIAVHNAGGWVGVAQFHIHYAVMMGDVDADGDVLPTDFGPIFPKIPTFGSEPDERADVDGNGDVLPTDFGPMFGQIPTFGLNHPKPNGHLP